MRPIHRGGGMIFPDEVEAELRHHPAVADKRVDHDWARATAAGLLDTPETP